MGLRVYLRPIKPSFVGLLITLEKVGSLGVPVGLEFQLSGWGVGLGLRV